MKPARIILPLLIALTALLCAWVVYNTYPVWREYLEDAPVTFRENEEVSLNLYPETFQSAAVFTNEGLRDDTPVESIVSLGLLIGKMGVRGTFFVTPFYYEEGELRVKNPRIILLHKLKKSGQEIAQYGFPLSPENGAELSSVSPAGRLAGIGKGREILGSSGFTPRGYRSPGFSGTSDTFSALDKLGFLYGSIQDCLPLTLRTVIKPWPRGRIMYPCHPRGLRVLEFISQIDPTEQPAAAEKIFRRFHRRSAVFVFSTRFPEIGKPENLLRLEKFLAYLSSQNTWLCTLEELCEWWLPREKVTIVTQTGEDTLTVIYGNPTSLPLRNAAIMCKKKVDHLKFYRIMNRRGEVSAAGLIPASRRIIVTLFSDRDEEAK